MVAAMAVDSVVARDSAAAERWEVAVAALVVAVDAEPPAAGVVAADAEHPTKHLCFCLTSAPPCSTAAARLLCDTCHNEDPGYNNFGLIIM